VKGEDKVEVDERALVGNNAGKLGSANGRRDRRELPEVEKTLKRESLAGRWTEQKDLKNNTPLIGGEAGNDGRFMKSRRKLPGGGRDGIADI